SQKWECERPTRRILMDSWVSIDGMGVGDGEERRALESTLPDLQRRCRRMWGRSRKNGVSGREDVSVSRPLTVISSHRGWFDWRRRSLWRCRDLVSLFVRRDFVTYYKQTILGPAWHVFQPLLTTLTYIVIFGKVAGLPTDGAPPFLFYWLS